MIETILKKLGNVFYFGVLDPICNKEKNGDRKKNYELSLNFSGVLRQWHITLLNPIIQTLRNA